MSTIGTLSSLSSGPNASSSTPNKFNELTSEDFVKIMFTELSNQDPLKPNDSNQLLQQMSSLRSIEADMALQKKLDTVVTQNQLSTAGALLGKYVSGYDADYNPAEGVVKSVSQTTAGPVLNLAGGKRVPFAYVDRMSEAPAATAAPAAR